MAKTKKRTLREYFADQVEPDDNDVEIVEAPKKKARKICSHKKCSNEVGNFATKSGKPSKLCQHHYERNRKAEEKRPPRQRDYKAYDRKRAKDPKRIAYCKKHGRTHKPYEKYRKRKRAENKEAFLKHNNELSRQWRKNNPKRWKKLQANSKRSTKDQLTRTKRSARERKKEWKISDGLAQYLFQQNCGYCGISAIERDRLNNIDRIDNEQGYTVRNVISCCSMCNNMKRKSEKDVFLNKCEHIVTHNKLAHGGKLYPHCFADRGSVTLDQYQNRAKTKDLPFEMTEQVFETLGSYVCYICGKPNTETHCNGIGRINNKLGYVQANVIACCGDCNYMKKAYDLQEFLDRCLRIYKYQQKLRLQ